jgi:exopolysaccharide production protein ExoZ
MLQAPSVFFRRRLIRIAPLYWAVTIVYLSFFLVAHSNFAVSNNSVGTIIASFVFLPYPKPDGSMFPVHMLGWTLNYEMFFYAIFAITVMLSRQRAVATTPALLVSFVAFGHLFAPLPQPLAFWSDPIILEFCLGMMLAFAYRAGVRLPRGASYGLLIGAILALAATKLRGIDLAWRTLEWGLPAAALVGALVLSREERAAGVVGRSFLFLGSASYSLYLRVRGRETCSIRPNDRPAGFSLVMGDIAVRAFGHRSLLRLSAVRKTRHARAATNF